MSIQIFRTYDGRNHLCTISVLCISSFGQSDGVTNALQIAEVVLAFIFILETAIKLVAIPWKVYMLDYWNRFDLFIALACIAGIVIEFTTTIPSIQPLFGMIRVLKLAKVLYYTSDTMKELYYLIVTVLPIFVNLLILSYVHK